mmetsp:Transcript_23750/g.28524  ORF Transcript_23750/g.28524 Transcript_23750/m.28524 type:complete len:117 (+) Transcript_23750:261-611(+)
MSGMEDDIGWVSFKQLPIQYRSFLAVENCDCLSDTGRAFLALDFDRAFRDHLLAASLVIHFFDRLRHAQFRVHRNHIGEANFVGAVIDAARHAFNAQDLWSKHRDQRQSQIAMRDG